MLNAIQNEGDYEKLNFLFWKARDKKFVLQDRDSGEKKDLPLTTRITFDTKTLQTGYVKWVNKVPTYYNDTVPGIDDPHPEPDHADVGTNNDPYKRFASVAVIIDGSRYQFSAEGVTSVGVLAALYKGVMDLEGMSADQISSAAKGLASLPDFEVTFDGIKEFDSKAGTLGKPVWADLEVVKGSSDTVASTDEKPVDNVEEDDIPF